MAGYGSVVAGAGGLVGGLLANSMMGDAAAAANKQYSQGRNYLTDSNNQQRADFQPYMQAGTNALGQYQNTLAAGSGAVNPTQSQDFNFDTFKSPAAQYRIDQANAGINASALAKGNVGGGLAKALASNSQNMASEEYANAFNQYLQKNQQDFGQQQQLWNNANQNWQTQLGGYQNLMGQGLNATSTTGSLANNYANAYNNNLMNQAQMNYGAAADRAGALTGGLNAFTSGISTLPMFA